MSGLYPLVEAAAPWLALLPLPHLLMLLGALGVLLLLVWMRRAGVRWLIEGSTEGHRLSEEQKQQIREIAEQVEAGSRQAELDAHVAKQRPRREAERDRETILGLSTQLLAERTDHRVTAQRGLTLVALVQALLPQDSNLDTPNQQRARRAAVRVQERAVHVRQEHA